MSISNEETQPMCETQIEALAYIDTLGGREFTALEVAEKVYASGQAEGVYPSGELARHDSLLIFGISCVTLRLLGVQDPYDDELPVKLPERRMFLSFRRDGKYGYDEVNHEDYTYDNLTHVDFDHATDEQKQLHGERLQFIADEAQRDLEGFGRLFEPMREAIEANPELAQTAKLGDFYERADAA